MSPLRWFMVASLLLVPGLAQAQDAGDCNGLSLNDDPKDFSIARVSEGSKVYFSKNRFESPLCPSVDPICQRKGYVLPGDQLVVGPEWNGYRCATFVPKKGNNVEGWLPVGRLQMQPDMPQDWVGEWERDALASFSIKPAKNGLLHISGDAVSRLGDSPNVGEIRAKTKPDGFNMSFVVVGDDEEKTLPFDQAQASSCAVRMKRVGAYLAIQDNGNCGGANVYFFGIYRRK